MNSVFQELTLGSQARFNSIRRKTQFFSTFAGGVVEALRESGYRLSNFRRHDPAARFQGFGAQPQGAMAARMGALQGGGVGNIELEFEQRDRDRCKVLVIPYRTDLPFLSKGHYYAQLGLELSRYSNDPDVLRKALSANSRGNVGTFLGAGRLPKLYLASPADLQKPGTMTFELKGARLVVAMNVILDLGKYRESDFDLDIPSIRGDLQALFYGLEKYLSLLLENFGDDVVVEEEEPAEKPQEAPEAASEAAPQTPPAPTSSQAPTQALKASDLDLDNLER